MFLCNKCACSNPSAFYPYQKGECKDCTRTRVCANRDLRVDYYRAFDRERGKTTERKADIQAKNIRKRKSMGPIYDKAHNAVLRAVKKGALIFPGVCQRCPSTERVQAHHDDYSRLLDVMWLCPICHAARHKELGRLRVMSKFYGDTPVVPDQTTAVIMTPFSYCRHLGE